MKKAVAEVLDGQPNALKKSDILSACDLDTRVVPVPEWGGEITLGTMTAAARDLYEQEISKYAGKEVLIENMRARYLAYCVIDPETGELMFKSSDIQALGAKNGEVIGRLFSAACLLNATGIEGMEDVTKN